MTAYSFQTSYKKNIGKNYMIIESNDWNDTIKVKDFRIRMLHENVIPGLLNTHVQYIDNIPSYQYDITGMQSLDILLDTSPLTYPILCRIFLSIYNALLSIENYLLLHDHIILSPEYIYLTADFSDVRLCYCPLKEDSLYDSIRTFFDYLLKKVNHSDEKCVYLAYSMHRCCNDVDFNLTKLYEQLSTVPNEDITNPQTDTPHMLDVPTITQATTSFLPTSTKQATTPCMDVFLKRDDKSKNKKIFTLILAITTAFLTSTFLYASNLYNLEFYIILLIAIAVIGVYNGYNIFRVYGKTPLETAVSSNIRSTALDSSTVMLAAAADINSHKLIYTGNGDCDDITLTHYPFVVGKTESCSAILQNSAISRIHAKLSLLPVDNDSEDIFIEDLNSTNGTLLNNNVLTPYEKYPLTSGDHITFGHLTYIFR